MINLANQNAKPLEKNNKVWDLHDLCICLYDVPNFLFDRSMEEQTDPDSYLLEEGHRSGEVL